MLQGYAVIIPIQSYASGVSNKNRVIETNRQFENKDFASTTDASIDFTRNGELINAEADIKIINDNREPLDSYLFSLNPSLNVLKITSAGRESKIHKNKSYN